jgi:hypothetical protein
VTNTTQVQVRAAKRRHRGRTRHLDIQQQQVGREGGQALQCFRHRALPRWRDIRLGRQHAAQLFARRTFVVYDQDTHGSLISASTPAGASWRRRWHVRHTTRSGVRADCAG